MTLIGICGGTGSGKSTLANKIESHFKSSGVVKIRSDSYYKNHSTLTFNDRSKINYDHPSSIDFELLINNLKNLKNNKKIIEPIYSYKTHKRLKKSKIIFSKKIIIVEGLHIFCDKRIINLIDYSIYLDLDEKTRLQRRINRDVEFRGRSIDEVEQRYFSMCKPMHNKFINPSKKNADIILKCKNISLENILNLISKKITC
jgi:uridine kinase|tara:strand:+ start:2514 stop:3116 length:603 start_codon:yes stop_codon:yes gene_type:complete